MNATATVTVPSAAILDLLIGDVRRVIEEVNDHNPVGGSDMLDALKALEYNLSNLRKGEGGEAKRTQHLMRTAICIGRFKGHLDARMGRTKRGTKRWPAAKCVPWGNTIYDVFQVLMPDAR